MSQLAIFFNIHGTTGVYDLGIDPATSHLALTEDLSVAVALSVLTNKRALEGQIPPGSDRQGWAGDSYPITEGDQFGSWLWTLEGQPQLPATLDLARSYAEDCVTWMVQDGLVSKIETAAEFAPPGLRVRIGLQHSNALRWSPWWAVTL